MYQRKEKTLKFNHSKGGYFMKSIIKKKAIALPCVSICMLAMIASLSTLSLPNGTNSETNEPVAEAEVVNINVSRNQVKLPLAITDTELESELSTEKETDIYDSSVIKVIEDKSVEVNGGELLEDGGAFIEP